MNELLSSVFLALILGWVLWGAVSLVLPLPWALVLGLGLGAVAVAMARDTLLVAGLMALLEPLGVVLPLLILRQVAVSAGIDIPAFSSAELLVFLILYVAFLSASMGVVQMDHYRLGYAPMAVGAMVLALCLYGVATGNWFIPLVAVLGQLLWVSGIGSSNWFDHVLHATLVPVVAVVLILRLVG